MMLVMTAVKTTQLMVGMEIHVELATRTKMFSRSANLAHPDHYGADPNTLLDPVVAGLPGALPVMKLERSRDDQWMRPASPACVVTP